MTHIWAFLSENTSLAMVDGDEKSGMAFFPGFEIEIKMETRTVYSETNPCIWV